MGLFDAIVLVTGPLGGYVRLPHAPLSHQVIELAATRQFGIAAGLRLAVVTGKYPHSRASTSGTVETGLLDGGRGGHGPFEMTGLRG
jgi:hypothetical protein